MSKLNLKLSKSGVSSAISSRTRSLVRSIVSKGKWLRRAIWVWPIIAALFLGVIGLFLFIAVERRLKDDTSSRMQTILDADVAALQLWMQAQQKTVQSAAVDEALVASTEKLIAIAATTGTTQLELLQSPELKSLRDRLTPFSEAGGYNGWVIITPQQKIIASARNEIVGITVPKDDRKYAERVLTGITIVSPPRKSIVLLPDEDGEMRVGVPTMFAWAPIRQGKEKVIAALGMRIPPRKEFTQILSIARSGHTGDTYAVAQNGLIASESRFSEELRSIGLLAEDESSVLNIKLVNPEVDMVGGGRPLKARSEQALTKAAEQLLAGNSGVDVVGYRDYRGVMVIGAWKWLPDYEVGVITEQQMDEAFGILFLIRTAFWGMFALLGAAAIAIFSFMLVMQRINLQMQKAAVELGRLGQYSLEQKLGEGGMGVVYRGHHAMLQRPTAIKFLDAGKSNEESLARFEREVRLTARLSHPNTIAIYDYGRTPEGIFYYAMECLEGIDLESLVTKFGPLPEARVVNILKQVCGSLAEAHGIGLIHRDVKPANIFLTCRGGIVDFVKLLDFGLVKAVDEQKIAKLTSAGGIAGTPLYLSPEAIERPDSVNPRSDLYAVGSVGYFLLTGTPVFAGKSVVEIMMQQVSTIPDAPSHRLGKPVSPSLEMILLKCLEKSAANRPNSAAELAQSLEQCSIIRDWSATNAAEWWTNYAGSNPSAQAMKDSKPSVVAETIVTQPMRN